MADADAGSFSAIWHLASIPLLSALIGWGTNILALKMTFYPLEFIGLDLGWYGGAKFFQKWGFGLGWQGIIPSKAEKMARKTVRMMTEHLIDVKEVFGRIDAEAFQRQIQPGMLKTLERVINQIGLEQAPELWESLPPFVKDELYLSATENSSPAVEAMMEEMKLNIEDHFNLEEFVVQKLMKEKALLNQVFLDCGEKEFVFIEHSGFYFGFLFGIVQAGIWLFCKNWWILPVAGLMCGYFTNWAALKLIFQPLVPTKVCCCFTMQGLFLKHQEEVSAEFAKLCAGKVLTADQMLLDILQSGRTRSTVEYHINRAIDLEAGFGKPFLTASIGATEIARIKQQVASSVMEDLPRHIKFVAPYTDEAIEIEDTMKRALIALSPGDFEGLLHPVFEEDEFKLLLVGGALGFAVGMLQVMFIQTDADWGTLHNPAASLLFAAPPSV